MSAFVKKIENLEFFPDGVTVQTEDGQRVVMSNEWYLKNGPQIGDYLTHCNDGYYSICRSNAFNAIRQVYFI